MPGALDIMCESPCGNTMMSPAESRSGGSPMTPPQQIASRHHVIGDEVLSVRED